MAKAPQLDACIFCGNNPCTCNAAAKAPKPRRVAAPKEPKPVEVKEAPAPVVRSRRPNHLAAMSAAATVARPVMAAPVAPVQRPVTPVAATAPAIGQDDIGSAGSDGSGHVSAAPYAGHEETAAVLLRTMLGATPVGKVGTRDDPAFQAKLIRERRS